jgi:hypothetical protein
LQILDAFTNEDISNQFGLNSGIQNFELNENGNSALTWKIKVPKCFIHYFKSGGKSRTIF